MPNAELLSLIPRPASIRSTGAAPLAIDRLSIAADGLAAAAGRLLESYVRSLPGVRADGHSCKAMLRLEAPAATTGHDSDESYQLRITDHVELIAPTAIGLLHGVQTIRQLIQVQAGRWVLPAVEISDRPTLRWRGLMLDCGRHFYAVDEVCRLIDLAAMYRINRFHMHLTDDQGWRVEIKEYPKLTEIGAWRDESPLMGDANAGDGTPYGGYYTQDDLRTIVSYAADRGIVVVPEIEMPGHSTAAIAAYPHLGNTDIPDWQSPKVSTRWGVHHNTFAPREETFRFIADVLDELVPIFPGPWFHIGGDEAPKKQWLASPFAQEVMRTNGLADGEALQSWFLQRVERMLSERGKRLVGWDEIQEGGLPTTATVMIWRDSKWARPALERGNPIVMAVQTHTYFDYQEGAVPDRPEFQTIGGVKWRPGTSLEKTMQWNPTPADMPDGRQDLLLGTQAQIWTEYIWSMAKVEYQLFPRFCAFSEIAWSGPITDTSEFSERLSRHLGVLDRLGVNYRKPDGTPARPDADMTRTARPRK